MESTIISASAALVGVLIGQVFARSGEYRKWLRTERHRVAAELLATGEAVRVHWAATILSVKKGAEPQPGEPDFDELYMADLERLEVAVEAVRTVFPARVAKAAEDFDQAVRVLVGSVTHTSWGEVPGGARYKMCRSALTNEVRRLVAPSFGDFIRRRREAAFWQRASIKESLAERQTGEFVVKLR